MTPVKPHRTLLNHGRRLAIRLPIAAWLSVLLPPIAAGYYHGIFVKSGGSLWAMGCNQFGQLGDGTFANRYSPAQVVPLVIPQPVVTGVTLANPNLILSGTNAESGRMCYTLMSTNLEKPLSQRTTVATNSLTNDGAFTIAAANAVIRGAPQQFYVLQAQ
jgi:hypothetical protein